MSGIVALYHRRGQPVAAELEPMLAALAHRGPDGVHTWRDGAVGLGHLLLRTTPDAPGAIQPLVAGELAITADARLDNRAELIQALRMDERPAHELADAALLLAAYAKWGERCVDHLLGDFAFAVWDGRTRELFCVRDHLGVRPFYYHATPARFACASEIKALLSLPDVTRTVDDGRVAEFLALLESEGKDATCFQEIRRLPPGHWLRVTPDALTVQPYWALDPERTVEMRSDAEYAEAFHALFADAVRCRLRTPQPVGVILSGGLDSACTTVMARAVGHGTPPLHTFSAWFTGPGDTDERPFIDAIVRGGGLTPHAIDGNDLGFDADELARIVRQQEEPFWYAFLLVLWRLYALAQAQGVRVLLDGVDGDAVVASCGGAYLRELVRAGDWRTFVAQVDGAARRRRPGDPLGYARYWAGRLRDSVAAPLLLAPVRQGWTRLTHTPPPLAPYIAPALAERTDLAARLARHAAVSPFASPTVRQCHYGSLTQSAFPYHLEMLNRAAAAFGLEYRHPFFDKRLVEFSLAIPAAQRYDRGQTRGVLRRALAGLLPDAIYQRPGKGGVGHHYLRSTLTTGAPSCRERILAAPAGDAAYLAPATLHRMWREFTPPYNKGNINSLWYTATVTLWLHEWIGHPA
jgi:asparagine synthase (glutamine-hydrolysing)